MRGSVPTAAATWRTTPSALPGSYRPPGVLCETVPTSRRPTRRRTATGTTATVTCSSTSTTGETQAVLDRANLSAADPAYKLATVESHLVADDEPQERAAEIRERIEAAYTDAREGRWFDEGVRERMRVYRLTSRLDAMASLPLWHWNGTPEDRDERERQHREAVAEYL